MMHSVFNETVRYFTSRGCKVYSAFLDASKAFDKVLHNGLYKKLLDRIAPLCLCYWRLIGIVSYIVQSDGMDSLSNGFRYDTIRDAILTCARKPT